ncbi:hypothetical protein KUV51_20885 [Tateyamaria omphalii]|uniref:hypothetical protein n=1 Tax=Tateyamaria omphalii TaxID=299262 RepID=UPI001C99F1FE|nr:hypothetical protein [Tateyamaria omphalii]MBY5935476.1 hypothetical protein [Tateyamaria omphalii]
MTCAKNLCIIAIAAMGLAACVTPPPAGKISDTAISQTTLSVAAQAVDICGRTFPNVTGTAEALQQAGFSETAERFENGKELDDPSRQVRVQVGERPAGGGRKEHVCLISVIGMTPEQGFALAQPWVQRYGAITNAEAGQGLSPRAIQAWRSQTRDRIVFIAARKANNAFRQAGASVRLIFIQ